MRVGFGVCWPRSAGHYAPAVKVLHVIPSISHAHGGPSAALKSIVGATARAGVSVEVATTDDDGPAARLRVPLGEPVAAAGGLTAYYFARQTRFYKVSLPLMRWLTQQVANYDIVHIHSLFSFSSTVAARLAKHLHVPYIIRPLGVLRRYGMLRRRPNLKRLSFALNEAHILAGAGAVHFTSLQESSEAEEWGVSMRSLVIPLGIAPVIDGSKERFLQKWPQLRSRTRLLYLGRLDPVKNLENLILALLRVLTRAPDTALIIAGDGDAAYTTRIRHIADGVGISESIVWTGHLAGTEKSDAFAAADVFVLPSLSESFGIAAAEALAAGVPCVVGRGVGLASEVESAHAGVAVGTDPDAIAYGILALLSDQTQLAAFGQSARILASAEFSEDAMGAGIVKMYREVLEAFHVGTRRRMQQPRAR